MNPEDIERYKNMTEEQLQNLSEEEFLIAYKHTQKKKYEKASNTVDMVILTVDDEETEAKNKVPNKKLQALMIKRGGHPYKNKWALTGGFMNMDETLEEAVKRELKEETRIENVYTEQLYTESEVNRDKRMRVISTAYLAVLPKENLVPIADDDALEAEWLDIVVDEKVVKTEEFMETKTKVVHTEVKVFLKQGTDIVGFSVMDKEVKTVGTIQEETLTIREDSNFIAFDHAKILYKAIMRIRGKLNYSNIAFNLLPTKFTLTELQKVYEAIAGKQFYPSPFRKSILGKNLVVKTNEKQTNKAFRKANLYEYNMDWLEDNL